MRRKCVLTADKWMGRSDKHDTRRPSIKSCLATCSRRVSRTFSKWLSPRDKRAFTLACIHNSSCGSNGRHTILAVLPCPCASSPIFTASPGEHLVNTDLSEGTLFHFRRTFPFGGVGTTYPMYRHPPPILQKSERLAGRATVATATRADGPV